MKVKIWNGKNYQEAGKLHAEATKVPFTKLIRLNTGEIEEDTIKVILTCLKDVWKIDAIGIDWTPVQHLIQKPVKHISMIGPDGKDVSTQLAISDNNYSVLLPPESIELRYKAEPLSNGKKIVYILHAQGYLYEWFPTGNSQNSTLTNILIPEQMRIEYLKILLESKSVFLPPIYSEWFGMKNKEIQQ